jgi:hypothetical protein
MIRFLKMYIVLSKNGTIEADIKLQNLNNILSKSKVLICDQYGKKFIDEGTKHLFLQDELGLKHINEEINEIDGTIIVGNQFFYKAIEKSFCLHIIYIDEDLDGVKLNLNDKNIKNYGIELPMLLEKDWINISNDFYKKDKNNEKTYIEMVFRRKNAEV